MRPSIAPIASRKGLLWATIVLTGLALGTAALTFKLASDKPAVAANAAVLGPETVLDIPWGSSGASVGRHDGDEGSSEGPSSFALSPAGQVYVLDQVNYRIARFDTQQKLIDQIPLPADTFEDLELWGDGRIVLLDRLARSSLMVFRPDGKAELELPVVGQGIEEGGNITALMAQPDGIWVEYGHTHMVRLLDESLQPCTRKIVSGRPSTQANTRLRAELDTNQKGQSRLWIEENPSGRSLHQIPVRLDHPISRIVWLAADERRHVHALYHLVEYDPQNVTRVAHESVVGVRYDEQLQPQGTFRSPYFINELAQFREARVMPDGTVYQMAFTNRGMLLLRWRWTS